MFQQPLNKEPKERLNTVTGAGMLIAIGIVFGDIGTSPLYTLKGIAGEEVITKTLAYGSVSAIFWTLTFQTTLKYVLITLRADNNGEGGIFALYTLVRRFRIWLLFLAMAGGSFLLADSIITPPISVTSSIEGLVPLYPRLPVLPIVIAILIALFLFQRVGTSVIGNIFGPVMFSWFSMIAFLGIRSMAVHWDVLSALNPYYAWQMLTTFRGGFWLLGGVFLCTTGAEALYSDMGHVGRKNIQFSWIYVKICLVLNYLGQSAWLVDHLGQKLGPQNPFFALCPTHWLIPCIVVATLATIIASQALISGSYTLINEAIRLNLWPKLKIVFPSDSRGQLYIPSINSFLLVACVGVVLYFKKSENMEAAYGLSISLTMIATTMLLVFYFYSKQTPRIWLVLLLCVYLSIEGSFLIANLKKFEKGGWITLVIGSVFFMTMYIWQRATELMVSLNKMEDLTSKLPLISAISNDQSLPKFATNLIYFTHSEDKNQIEKSILYSIFYRTPKRADFYWLVHVKVEDEPYRMGYQFDVISPDDLIYVTFHLGFRIVPRLNLMFQMVVDDMVKNGEVAIESKYKVFDSPHALSDFRFVLLDTALSFTNELSYFNNLIMEAYFLIKKINLPTERQFGLDYSDTIVESVPLVITEPVERRLVRE